jgi:hypothetical protein
MWKIGYAIMFFGFGGALFNAAEMEVTTLDVEENLFDFESEAWDVLKFLHDLNPKLVFTVQKIMKHFPES